MVEINCSLPFFTKVCSILCGGLIAFMAIQRLINLSNAKIQDYILSVHFMFKILKIHYNIFLVC